MTSRQSRTVAERQSDLGARFSPWSPRTLFGMLETAAKAFPDRPYLIFDAQIWTYDHMADWSRRVAAGLIAAGVKRGEHVALVMANYPAFAALKYAISAVGAVAVPVNILNRREELAYVLRQSRAVMLVTMDRFRDLDYLTMLDELSPSWATEGGGEALPHLRSVVVFQAEGQGRDGATPFDDLKTEPVPLPVVDPQSAADIIYTSGTTGSPKGVMLSHDMLLRAAFGSAYARAFEDGRRIQFSLPMNHVYGYVEGLLAALFVGGAVVPHLKFDPRETLKTVERHRVTDLLLIPTMTLAVLDALEGFTVDTGSLKGILSSGGRTPPGLWDRILHTFEGIEITTGYGMSECTASTTVTRPDDPTERLLTTNGRLRDVGPAGDPEIGNRLVDYRVIDPSNGAVLSPGQVGELMARGPGVTQGYYDKPEATAEAFDAEGWLHTGDLGRIDADGYLTLVGRVKESYRCGGEQVTPSEIEDVLMVHPAVLQAHVAPVPDDRMGEIGVAFVVTRPGHAFEPQALVDWCSARLARFKVPRHVLPIEADAVPLTPSGRPRKFLLSKRAADHLGLS
ncbi:class I adenylate-forming enzyme family protein [Brevundimonas variabilis]|uniref:Fatty-acyl-CoA synthase n=1 Tax=Brevundimonas variabilis TaxID=74312 RepID=A0A7W9FFK3_9CAUL|nr:AMP-binding protein [Brevundimonas variabilis]MBB5747581.1 fatty-acyl-CoA synthase [Brevundimonas variabilis]